MMTDDDTKVPAGAPADEKGAGTGAIVDEGWAQVDLHDRKETPKPDLPSDIQALE